jgi:hypothetical protein
VPRIAEQGVGIIGNFVGMPHKKNGAHVLGVRTRSKSQRKQAQGGNSCGHSHKEPALVDYYSTAEVQRIPRIKLGL